MRFLLLFVLACSPTPEPPGEHCSDAQSVQLDTPDGARIALHRHKTPGPPVVVVHGIASNHNCWDLTEDRSLAVVLEDAGFDAWLLDLRGHGDAMLDANGERQRHGWNLDDYGKTDLHTAIEHIRTTTGSDKVAIVGHSMGGMVAAAYHGHHGDDRVAALVVVGSPLNFEDPNVMFAMGQVGFRLGSLFRSFGVHTYAHQLGHINGALPVHGEYILFNPRNMEPAIRQKMLKQVASPVSREELQQFERIFKNRRFTSSDGVLDYVDALGTLDVPFMAISGAADKIAPPDRVKAWTTAVASEDIRYIEASVESGFQVDYGHLDLAFGDQARVEILQPIAVWLGEHKSSW